MPTVLVSCILTILVVLCRVVTLVLLVLVANCLILRMNCCLSVCVRNLEFAFNLKLFFVSVFPCRAFYVGDCDGTGAIVEVDGRQNFTNIAYCRGFCR